MALNWREIDAILEELELSGCFIRQIHQPDYCSLVFDLYRGAGAARGGAEVARGGAEAARGEAGARHGAGVPRGRPLAFKLFVSLANPHARLHRLTRKLPNPRQPLRFATFLRASVRNGRFLGAEQLADERIVRLTVRREDRIVVLWIRLWATAANVIATDESGRILDAFYRRPKRGEISGETYAPEVRTADAPNRSGASPADSNRAEYAVRDYSGPGDLNERVERAFFEREREEEKDRLKKKALREIRTRVNGIRSRLDGLERRRGSVQDPERLRELGDLLKTALHSMTTGERWVTVADYCNDNAPVEIELDPRLSPAENAESYYRRYKKAHRTAERLEEEIRSLELSLSELEGREAALTGETDLEALRRAASSAAAAPAPKNEAAPAGLLFATESYHFLVGRTSAENDLLLRHHVKGNDFWFHVRDFPGAYVFLKHIKKGSSGPKSIPLEAMLDAGNLALFYSKARSSGQADVYYTRVKYLRRAREGRRGTVIPTQEKNLFIKAEPKRIERLQRSRVV